MRRALAIGLFSIASLASPAAAQRRPCAGIECSGHGACFPENGAGHCLCDAGFAAVGTSCVQGGPPEEDVLRARRDPRAGQRVASIAEQQVGRFRAQIGMDLDRHPFALRAYLMPGEWWCGDFVAWVYEAAGVGLSGGSAGGWLVPNNVTISAWFDERGQWIANGSARWSTYQPRAGDFLRFRTDRGGHAALVHHVLGETLYTVEGNVSGVVDRGVYPDFRHDASIAGIGVLALPNEPPRADAGENVAITWNREVVLRATVEDDGPLDHVVVAWRQAGGTGHAHCVEDDALVTGCSFSAVGRYVLRFTADDGEHVVSDDVIVEARANRAPIVSAHVVALDAGARSVRVSGRAQDDEPVALHWDVRSGPGRAVFVTPDRLATTVYLSEPGSYELRLSADDGESVSSRDVRIDVPGPSIWSCAMTPHGRSVGWLWLLAPLLGVWRARRRIDLPSRLREGSGEGVRAPRARPSALPLTPSRVREGELASTIDPRATPTWLPRTVRQAFR